MKEYALHVRIVSVAMMMMIVSMPVAMSVSVCVTMVEGENPNHIHNKAHKTDQQKPMRIHLWGMKQPLNGFNDDKDRNQAQEDAVGES